jgi:hypothetical protein
MTRLCTGGQLRTVRFARSPLLRAKASACTFTGIVAAIIAVAAAQFLR